MTRYISFLAAVIALVLVAGCQSTSVAKPESEEPGEVSFTKDIKPIFQHRCVMCHNAKTLPGKLSFENRAGAFIKDQHGLPYIIAGKPDESRLYINIITPEFHELAMPPVSHRVSKEEVKKIRDWI